MPGSGDRLRLALFCLCALLLLLAATVFGRAGGETSGMPLRGPPLPLRQPSKLPRGSGAALRDQAMGFLSAFFRYEIGAADRGVRRDLHRTATAGFARALLAQIPPPAGRASVPARLTSLSIARLPGSRTQAVVSGAAARGGRIEQFSFLFVFRAEIWLASGPGE